MRPLSKARIQSVGLAAPTSSKKSKQMLAPYFHPRRLFGCVLPVNPPLRTPHGLRISRHQMPLSRWLGTLTDTASEDRSGRGFVSGGAHGLTGQHRPANTQCQQRTINCRASRLAHEGVLIQASSDLSPPEARCRSQPHFFNGSGGKRKTRAHKDTDTAKQCQVWQFAIERYRTYRVKRWQHEMSRVNER